MFCLKITHAVIDFDRCLHFRFMIYKHAFSFFLPCLSFYFLFFQNVATNGCLTQTSRIISQGYTCIYYVLPFPLHIILITPQHYWEITTGIVFRISHQTLHLFPQKLDWILTWITNWLFSERVFSVCRLFSVLVLEMHLYLRGISLILPSVLSVAPRSISVCCCVLSCTNKTRPPPSPHCVAFHRCLVPAMNLPPDSNVCGKRRLRWHHSHHHELHMCFVMFFSFQIIKAFVLMLDLSHPLSSPLPLTSLHSDSNPPCQLCCWHGGRRRYSFIASICQ